MISLIIHYVFLVSKGFVDRCNETTDHHSYPGLSHRFLATQAGQSFHTFLLNLETVIKLDTQEDI